MVSSYGYESKPSLSPFRCETHAQRSETCVLVNPKIAGKWMFIPVEWIIIGFDPHPYIMENKSHVPNHQPVSHSFSASRIPPSLALVSDYQLVPRQARSSPASLQNKTRSQRIQGFQRLDSNMVS